MNETNYDKELRQKAKARASFQTSLTTYLIFQVFFVLIRYFTTYRYSNNRQTFWPIYPMIGRGIGIVMQYFKAYGKSTNIQKEYDKLLEEKNK